MCKPKHSMLPSCILLPDISAFIANLESLFVSRLFARILTHCFLITLSGLQTVLAVALGDGRHYQ